MSQWLDPKVRTGRGVVRDIPNRFEKTVQSLDPDVVQPDPSEEGEISVGPKTIFLDDKTESVITRNESPDIRFDRSLNPYRGCEHGCAYCYARSYHEYLGFSAGLDFETKIMVKHRAPELLRKELSKPRYEPAPLNMSGVTDRYQPAERRFKLTRACLEVLVELRHPTSMITKNYLVTRDLDLLKELAAFELIHVYVAIPTLDPELASVMEPRASRPSHWLRAIEMLASAGVPVGILIAPVIPSLTDKEVPALLKSARAAGATSAQYSMLRLPHGVKDIFRDWLTAHYPEKVDRIFGSVRDMRGGKLNESEFATRMKGEGHYADQVGQLFQVFKRKLGFTAVPSLRTDHFRRPGGEQMALGL